MDTKNPKKNYLVILAGSPRGGEKTWHSLYKYVVDPLNADLALCTSDKWNQESRSISSVDSSSLS